MSFAVRATFDTKNDEAEANEVRGMNPERQVFCSLLPAAIDPFLDRMSNELHGMYH